MKRFFAKASKPFAINTNLGKNSKEGDVKGEGSKKEFGKAGATVEALHATPGLKPKYLLPPVPQPCPYDHLAILPTEGGLLIRPYLPGQSKPRNPAFTHLRISWKSAEIVEVDDSKEQEVEDEDWSESVIVYGIVGMLELFSCSYLLVINSRTEVGNVLDPANVVYGLKGVTAIPLLEDRARTVISALASRNAALARPSLLPRAQTDDVLSPTLVEDEGIPRSSSPKVQFASDTDVKIMTPTLTPVATREEGDLPDPSSIERPPSAQSVHSDISTPSSENSMVTSPVFKTLAARLSFWSRLSKRPADEAPASLDSEFAMTLNPSSLNEEREVLDKLIEEEEEPAKVVEAIVQATAPPPATSEEKHKELEEKVVRECVRELTKGVMYWAYTFDITRSLQHKQEQIAKSQKQHELLEGLGALPVNGSDAWSPKTHDGEKVSPLAEPYPTLPLWRRIDKQFWWNEWMAKPFVDAGLHPYVLPIMQGYFQPAVMAIPPGLDDSGGEDVVVDYILISRRSRHRVGLRYQRRGIDDEAQVANFVETETIVRVEREKRQNIFSYVQIRGSIPLFWTQSGYSLKPPPVLSADRTHQQNLEALSRHFKRTVPVYGPHTVVNLAEKGGKEGSITQAYREYVVEFDNKDVQYCEYDFHHETKGMKYEKINTLVESMQRVFESQGYFWISDDTVLSHQKGVFRVNCIDCLDRTNVVQSAFARFVLNQQLSAVALLTPSATGEIVTDLIFNDVWANNGDAISRAYAGTSALKGDFTRTGKRDLSGMLNDGVNSLARMYTSTFSDWFSQAVIDFMLGSRTKSVFSEFLLKLQSTDPRDLIRLSKIRAEAIATATSRVLPEGERLISGWTLFAPEELDTRIGMKFEEKVLLLTMKALYIVSYDYTLEKVKLYTRVPLGEIISITKGAYILSPLEEASRDPEQNYGFVITWLTTHQESRATSYSVRNDLDLGSISNPSSPTTTTGSMSPQYPIPIKSPAGPSRSSSMSLAERIQVLRRNNTLPLKGSSGATALALSTALNNNNNTEKSFAAFKVLPIDPARVRRSSSAYSELSDELQGASTCREAGNMIVETIQRACEDVGSGGDLGFVSEEDIVSLAEAQRMTSVYAKMEYGVKRLLWLGG